MTGYSFTAYCMKRPTNKRYIRRIVVLIALTALMFIFSAPLSARKVHLYITVDSSGVLVTGTPNLAAGSDSLFCDSVLLSRDEYTINYKSGLITLDQHPGCGSLSFTAFQLPDWMTAAVGNAVPPGRKFLSADTNIMGSPDHSRTTARDITLSGNKSFAFIVGRSGEGTFSQGLNIEVDAMLADNLRLRGAISDRIGADGNAALPGSIGTTTTLGELDKYYFELIGTRVTAAAGDIRTLSAGLLPEKRIKGIGASYTDTRHSAAADIGRPSGRYESFAFLGVDGRQGPYQLRTANGLPTGVVAGSEVVYVDGRRIEGGTTSNYEIDYPAGRIIFSPRVLITSQTRIEVDFEALDTDFEQRILDMSQTLHVFDNRLRIQAGARRETDDKDRLRFGTLSPADTDILAAAGDSTTRSFRSGVTADTAGAYVLLVDSAGTQYYEYVGVGAGEYAVTFSYVGEGLGDYYYLGDGAYRFAGAEQGAYLPVVYLPLPSRNDFFFASGEMSLYTDGILTLSYRGTDYDKNLFSPIDDDDNFSSMFTSEFRHKGTRFTSLANARYIEANFASLQRIYSVDADRLWALPDKSRSQDETRIESEQVYRTDANSVKFAYGYINYKDYLASHRFDISADIFQDKFVSPHFLYQSGNSKSLSNPLRRGNFEKQSAGLTLRPIEPVVVHADYDREFSKSTYADSAVVNSYDMYTAAVRYRNTVATLSRRTDFTSGSLGVKGPRLDKAQLLSGENIGRLRMQLAVTLLEQEALDSDRPSRNEQLLETTFRYSGSGGWLSLLANYRQNRQNGTSTGFRYIYVGSGQGQYRFEDGQYLSDEDGDYIRIREERGETQSLSVGSKSHTIFIYPGRIAVSQRLKRILDQVAVRLRTEVTEELPGSDKRSLAWLLPWHSTSGLPYTNRTQREQYRVLFFPMYNFYAATVLYRHVRDEQEAGALLRRDVKEYGVELKQDIDKNTRMIFDFSHARKSEAGIGLQSLRLRNSTYGTSLVVNQGPWQITPRMEIETITDELSDGKAEGIAFIGNMIFRQTGKGELRLGVEARSLTEKQAFSQSEYLVTDGKRFGRSAAIHVVANFDISKTMRLNVNVSDLIYEKRPAEFSGKGEIIANF